SSLQVRFREEIAQNRFDDALVTAKTMFAMSRHMGEHPTLIGDLVGIAIAFVAIGPLDEMTERPGCPNLYWALTYLPAPLVTLDRGVEGERLLIDAELKDLDAVEPMTPAQIKKVIAHIDLLLQLEEKPKKTSVRKYIDERAADPKRLGAARARLVDY